MFLFSLITFCNGSFDSYVVPAALFAVVGGYLEIMYDLYQAGLYMFYIHCLIT